MIEQNNNLTRIRIISKIDNFMKNFKEIFGYLGFLGGLCLFLEPIVFNEMSKLFETLFFSVGTSIMALSLLSLSYKYLRNYFVKYFHENNEPVELNNDVSEATNTNYMDFNIKDVYYNNPINKNDALNGSINHIDNEDKNSDFKK